LNLRNQISGRPATLIGELEIELWVPVRHSGATTVMRDGAGV
jgi:hypothetical protein